MSEASRLPDGQQTLALDNNLDLTQATELSKSLSGLRGTDLVIDASEVRRVGAQCMQILVSAANSWRADQAKLTIANCSEEFLESSRLLGLRAALPIEEPCR